MSPDLSVEPLSPNSPPPPVRTWRPMLLWTLGILAALGLAWFVGAVAVPFVQVWVIIDRFHRDSQMDDADIKRLGCPEAAARKLGLYLRMSKPLAPHRLMAAWTLGMCGGPAVPELIGLLRDQDKEVRHAAACGLRIIRDKRAVGPLIAALDDNDENVRNAAAEALGWIGDPRAVEPLIAALGKDEALRWWAAGALGTIRDARAVEPLIAALQDKDNAVRNAAAEALGQIGDARAVEPLITKLQDKDRRLRIGAAYALGRIGDQRSIEPLIAALQEQEDKGPRRWAAWALGMIGTPRACDALTAALQDRDEDVRATAAEALKRVRREEPPK